MRIDLYKALRMVARAVDLVSPALSGHHERTACLYACIGNAMGISAPQMRNGFIAAMVHDIGGLSEAARLAPLAMVDIDTDVHARIGALLMSRVSILSQAEGIVYHHHTPWRRHTEDIPEESHILYLADRVDVMMNTLAAVRAGGQRDYLQAAASVRTAIINAAGDRFSPAASAAFLEISRPAAFWLALEPSSLADESERLSPLIRETISLTEFNELASLPASVLDSHSRSTARHSHAVAVIASRLGQALGYSGVDCLKLSIAGRLHDLGKLAIPATLLDYPGKLTATERTSIKRHAWITWELLSAVSGAEDIALWAGSHHETSQGTGYPHGVPADTLPEACRIITVADMWSALCQDRPYRKGLTKTAALEIMGQSLTSARDRRLLRALESLTLGGMMSVQPLSGKNF